MIKKNEILSYFSMSKIFDVPMNILPSALTELRNFFLSVNEENIFVTENQIKIGNFFFPMPSSRYEPRLTIENGVGIIPVDGPLFKKSDGILDQIFGYGSYEEIKDGFDKANQSSGVKAISFHINSPGGMSSGLLDLLDYITANKSKPLYSVVDDNAFSAAYGIAATADKIFVSRTGGVGSVGAIITHVDQSEYDRSRGLKYEEIYAGDEKAMFSPHKPLSDKARSRYQEMVDSNLVDFARAVALGRGKTDGEVIQTQARIYRGKEGIDVGFADELVSSLDAFSLIRQKHNIKEVKAKMDIAELKEKHPEVFSQVVSDAVASVQSQFESEKTELQKTITNLTKDSTVKEEVLTQMSQRMTEMENREIEREAANIWQNRLASCSLPESLIEKVKNSASIKVSDFIKETGFDKEAFSAAVDAEVKDWEDRAGSFQILGKGNTQREETNTVNDDDAVSFLWSLSDPPKFEKEAYKQ